MDLVRKRYGDSEIMPNLVPEVLEGSFQNAMKCSKTSLKVMIPLAQMKGFMYILLCSNLTY